MINFLIIDTETEGYYKDFSEPFTNTDNWPVIKQIAYIISDEDGNEILHRNHFILAEEEKIEIFKTLIKDITDFKPIIVGHNIDFDANIIGAELVRLGYYNYLLNCELICTMSSTVTYCDLENFKWPRLQELYLKVFNSTFEGAHNALNDVKATAECFFQLKKEKFQFEKYRDSIANYKIYEKEIQKRRENHFNIIYRAHALQELLRLFRLKKSEYDVEGEIDYYQNNFYKFSSEGIYEKANYDNLYLSEAQKSFYLENEGILVKKLGLDELNSNNSMEAIEKLKKVSIGFDLFVYCTTNKYDDDIEHLKHIAKDFSNYLFSYELHLRASKRQALKNYSNANISITIDDLIESLKSKIINNQIKMLDVPNLLASIFNRESYNLSKMNEDQITKRKFAIKQEMHELGEIINLCKPKVKVQEEFTAFSNILSLIYLYVPIEFRANIEARRDYFIFYGSQKKTDGCYIATFIYGSYDKEEVLILRKYRDTHLKTNYFGRLFISIYYNLSPTAVKFLKDKPKLNSLIKKLLDVVLISLTKC